MFNLFDMQVLDFIIIAIKRCYLFNCISVCMFNQLIHNPIIFVFKYLINNFLVIFFVLFEKLRESCIENIFKLINKESAYD